MARRFDRAKFEVWRRRLARFRSSELTVAEFCRREQVSLASYYYWSRRLGEAVSLFGQMNVERALRAGF
jgi:hypothetical protein